MATELEVVAPVRERRRAVDPPRGRTPLPAPLAELLAVPATLPALAAVAIFGWWASSQAGYPVTKWYPGALLLLALLAVALATLPVRVRELPRGVRIAGAALAAFTAWSYLSILWAEAPGDAWEGANRTLLYLVVFALFAAWAQRAESAVAVVCAWIFVVAGVALVTLLRLPSAGDPLALFVDRRLSEPAGYVNAAAATYMMAAWPALVLASRPELRWWLRGALAGAVVLLADVALLSQSRGSVIASAILVPLAFVIVRDRARLIAVLVPIAIAIGATVPGVLDVADRLGRGDAPSAVMSGVATPIVLALFATIAVVGGGAVLEGGWRGAPQRAAAIRQSIERGGIVTAVALVAIALALTGSPLATARDAWSSFKRGYPTRPDPTSTRLASGLGSNRYDFYRVALDRFAARPLTGTGADNFAADYLRLGRSDETPRYPHSLELRTLSQTGLVGGALLFTALVAGLAVAGRAARRTDALGAAVAAGATLAFAYWAVHGSADWFWEFAGLGAPAFALLGLACALAPRAGPPHRPPPAGRRVRFALAGAPLAGLLAASLAAPWLAERNVRAAARGWATDPGAAFRHLDRARSLDPLSDRPDLIAGSIALRLDRLDRARAAFASALERSPHGAYAALELGAIASARGDRAGAVRLLRRARDLNPRDPITADALARASAGERIDIAVLNQRIYETASTIAGARR